MAYMHRTPKGDWTLYNRLVDLNGGRRQTIYFFSKGTPKSGQPAEMPDGFEVKITERTGMPILKRA